MENCGERIATLRRENGMTQGQLGEALCVSAQAVSKWEHGLSEPDIGSIRKMASLFGVTIDYLLGAEEPDAVAAEENADAPRVVAVCTECGKALYEGEVYNRNGKALCAACNEHIVRQEKQAAEQKKRDEEYRRKVEEETAAAALAQRKYEAGRRLKKPLIIAGVVTGLWFVLSIVIGIVGTVSGYEDVGAYWGGAVISWALVFAFTYEMALSESVCREVFLAIAGFSIRMPGVIFSFSIEGCIFLIGMKILLAVLSGLLTVFMCIVAALITGVVSLFACPYDLVKAIREYRAC